MRVPVDMDVRITKAQADELARRALMALGYDAAQASIIGDHLVDNALCGYDYAALPRILAIADRLKEVGLGVPMTIEHETETSAVLNGGNQVGYLSVYRAMEIAIEKASATGIAAVTAYHGYYSGRNAYFLERICRAGFVGFHTASGPATVAAYGGAEAVLGTNPIAFGVPRLSDDPFIFDTSTAATTVGDVELAARTDTELPEGVGIDSSGQLTTDPHKVRNGGAIIPRAAHLGYGFLLTGQLFALLPGLANEDQIIDRGWLFIVFSPDLFGAAGKSFPERAERLLQHVESSRPIDANTPVRIPSQRAFAMRKERLISGLPINRLVHDQLAEMGGR